MSTGSLDSRIERVARTVWRTRRRFMATVLAAGLVLAVTVAAAWVLGGILLDLAVPLGVPARVAVWCGWWCVVALAATGFLLTPAIRRPVLEAIALRIERSLGGIHNRLLTVVDLASRGWSDGRSSGKMVERLLDQTQERLSGFRTARVVPWRTALRNLAIAGLVGASLAGLWLGLGERFRVTLMRLIRPTADIPPATWLEVSCDGDLDVLAREPFTIEARITRGEASAADLVLVDSRGRERRQPMHPHTSPTMDAAADANDGATGGVFVANLDGLESAHRYRIEAGNTWTRTHEIRLLPRPEVLSVERSVRLPSYMRYDAPLPVEADAVRIEAPEGSTVEFVAGVAGRPETGRLDLFGRAAVERHVERFDERVWFEDDLPRDAAVETPWRWTTARAAGGIRSFTFGHDGRPIAMRTRIEPLVLPKELAGERSIQLMVWSEPGAGTADADGSPRGPRALAMLLEYEGGRTEIVWGDAEAIPAAASASRFSAGPLGEPGRWTRCLAPLSKLPQLAGRSIRGMTFTIDAGRILLDRPGWVERSQEAVVDPVDFPTGFSPFALLHDEPADSTGVEPNQAWQTHLPVDRTTFAGMTFENRLGYPSLPVAPVEIVPTRDHPPSLHIDLPPESITLAVTDDVPLSAQAFDDWGLDAILIRVGPEPSQLGPPQPLEGVSLADRPPSTQLVIDTVLSAELLGLAAGRSAAWQIEVHDTKGQVAYGPIHRVTVVMPPEHALAKTQVPALAEAVKEAMKAAQEAMQKSESIDEKRDALLEAVGEQTLDTLDAAEEAHAAAEAARKPDGTVEDSLKTAAQEKTQAAQKAADEAVAALEAERKRDLEAVDAFLEKQRKQAEQVAKAAEKAAQQAAASPLVPQSSKDDLKRLAGEARAAEQALSPDKPLEGNAAKLDRAEDASSAEEMANAADELARALAEAANRLDAAGAAMQLQSLATDLAQRAESLAASSPQTPQGEQATAKPDASDQAANTPADTPAMPPAAPSQAVRQQIRELEQILGRSVERALAESETADPAASTPDDLPMETTASPQPSPSPSEPGDEPAPASPSPPPGQSPSGDQPASPAGGSPQPAPGQSPAKPGQPDPMPADQSTADAPAPDASAPDGDGDNAGDVAAMTPEAALDPAARAAMAAEQVADDVASLADSLASPDQPLAEDATTSPEVRLALAMAERARRLQARAAREASRAAARAEAMAGQERQPAEGTLSGEPTSDTPPNGEPSQQPSDGGALAGRTTPIPSDSLRGLSPAERAAIERLPPRVRDPLLDGMRAKGPSAYRDVIDAYFRHLGREMPK